MPLAALAVASSARPEALAMRPSQPEVGYEMRSSGGHLDGRHTMAR
jgi:hypothetical protein